MKRNAASILLVLTVLAVLIILNVLFFVEAPLADEDEISGSRSSYRSSPYGTLAFYTLLKESGYAVTRLETPPTELSEENVGTLIIISPPEYYNPTAEEFASLIEWVDLGGRLIIIDRTIEVEFGEAVVSTHRSSDLSSPRPLQPTQYVRGVERVVLSGHATRLEVAGAPVTYHLGTEQAAVLADLPMGEGRIVLLTDPYVVANNGIAEADNVVLALNLVSGAPAGSIAFDEYHHGYSSATRSGMFDYFKGTPIPWIIAQGAVIASLIVFTRGRRFARALPLARERRTTNLEFVSSMANITRLARATDVALKSIYVEFRTRLCRYCGLPRSVDVSRLADHVSRRTGADAHQLETLLLRCEAVIRGESIGDAELLDLVRRIRVIEASLPA